jgi:hypothetical protein
VIARAQAELEIMADEKRVISGADILGRLLRGIALQDIR